MKIEIHPSKERGSVDWGWLQTQHSFSFGEYHRADRMGFGMLRVLNDDIIQPSQGFPMHSHQNMEIVTLVLSGAIEHRDSMGNQDVISAGQVQRMSAGKGVSHSEYNASDQEPVRLLQIWIQTQARELDPSYEKKDMTKRVKKNEWLLVVAPENSSAVHIHQNVQFYLADAEQKQNLFFPLQATERGFYLYIIHGKIELQSHVLETGDAAALSQLESVAFSVKENSKLLLIDTPLNGF